MPTMNIPNFGLVNGLAEGANSFLNAYQTAKNLKFQQQKETLLSGLERDAGGNLVASPRLLAEQQAKTAAAEAQAQGLDPSSDVSASRREFAGGILGKPLPNTMSGADVEKFQSLLGKDVTGQHNENARESRGGYLDQSLDLRKDAIDRREHERVLTRINSNPNVKQRLTQYQNLDNALKIITDTDSLTPNQIHEFQQAVRSNMGIKGGGGVGEREATYFNSMGLNAANFGQFLTGDPATLAKDTKLMNHLKNMAQVEQKNIRGQFDKSLKAASGGHASMYGRRPDLTEDLKDAMGGQMEQMSAPPGLVQGQPGAPVQQGVMQGQPAAVAHPQDTVAIQYAKTHPNDPNSAEILKRNGL